MIIYSFSCRHNYLNSMSESKKKSVMVTETDDWGRKKFRMEENSDEEAPKQATETSRYKSMLIGREE